MRLSARILEAIRAAPAERRGYVLNEALRSNRPVSFSDLLIDLAPFFEAERDAERKAWARLVRAMRDGCRARDSGAGSRAVDGLNDAEQALRDLGVPVDKLLEES